MANFGTSRSFHISGEDFVILKGFTLSKIKDADLVVDPPKPENSSDILSITKYLNKHRDFTFQKICPPLYGPDDSTARYTGIPANQPDHVADFHFIGIMRAVDDIISPRYTGYISGNWNSINPK